MKFRWHFPLSLFIKGPSPDALNLAGEFVIRDIVIKFRLRGNKPELFSIPDKPEVFAQTINSISFSIEDTKRTSLQLTEYPQLLTLFVSSMNRVLRSIRNTGMVSSAKEINPHKLDAEKLFRKWAVEATYDGDKWTRLVEDSQFQAIIDMLVPDNLEELDSSLLSDIEESIQDNIIPPPEYEFFVNCLEYLNNRNFRMAVVESVMCLDIVTSQYLNSYLASYKNMPADRIKLLLQPQLGLSARIAGLLDLCLQPSELKKIEFKKVLNAIKWRNNIIHKSGHLPQDMPEEMVLEYILSVLRLVFSLAMFRNQIESLPEIQNIGTELSKRMSIPFPNIWIAARHRIIMEISFFSTPHDFPVHENLEAIVQEAIKLLLERDKRFRGGEHLYVRFYRFPKELRATWREGKLIQVPVTSHQE